MQVKVIDQSAAAIVQHRQETGPARDLRDVMGDDDAEYERALAELERVGRYWTGGGSGPLFLLMRAR